MFFFSTSNADAAKIRQPQEPQAPVTTPEPGTNNSKPAVDFDPDIWVQMANQNPYPHLDCEMTDLSDKIGQEIIFMNHSGKTIPAGSIITWDVPGYKKITMTVDVAIPPGGGMGTDVPKWMKDLANFTCSVNVDWTPARVL